MPEVHMQNGSSCQKRKLLNFSNERGLCHEKKQKLLENHNIINFDQMMEADTKDHISSGNHYGGKSLLFNGASAFCNLRNNLYNNPVRPIEETGDNDASIRKKVFGNVGDHSHKINQMDQDLKDELVSEYIPVSRDHYSLTCVYGYYSPYFHDGHTH